MIALPQITISDIRDLGSRVAGMRRVMRRAMRWNVGVRLQDAYTTILLRHGDAESVRLTPSEEHLIAALRANDIDAVTKHLIAPTEA